jgi:hypothetical protein
LLILEAVKRNQPSRTNREVRGLSADGAGQLFSGVVRRTDQRTGLDVGESHAHALIGELLEFLGSDPPIYREMEFRRLEVLAECDQIHIGVTEVPQ